MSLRQKVISLKNRIKESYNEADAEINYVEPSPDETPKLSAEQVNQISAHLNSAINIYKEGLELNGLQSSMSVCCSIINGMDYLSALDLTAGLYKHQIKKCFKEYPDKPEFIDKIKLFTDNMIGELDGGSQVSEDTKDAK